MIAFKCLAAGVFLAAMAALPADAQTLSGRCLAQASDQITCSVEVGTGTSISVVPRLISRGALSPVTATAELVFMRGGTMVPLGGANIISASSSTNTIGGRVLLQRSPREHGMLELTIRNCRNGSVPANCQTAFPPTSASFQLLVGN